MYEVQGEKGEGTVSLSRLPFYVLSQDLDSAV
jgi:hypothetical protein